MPGWKGEGWSGLDSSGTPVISAGTTLTIALNVTLNQNVGAPLSATNSPTAWSIISNPANSFGITNAGQVYMATIDIAPQSYSLTVQATNSFGSGTATVTVNVTTTGTIYYVATNGNDSNNGTSTATPFLTLNRASTAAVNPGDAVLFRGGTYAPVTSSVGMFSGGGSSTHQIYYAPYQQESVTLSTANVSGTANIQVNISYITLIGFNIVGAVTRGDNLIAMYGSVGGRLINLTVTNGWGSGLWVGGPGSNNAVINCIVHDCCLNNVNDVLGGGGGWGSGISINTDNSIVDRCTVHDNWGEGIDLIDSSGGTVSNCVVYDNFSVLVYMSSARNATIANNLVYATAAKWGNGGDYPLGIIIARENAGIQSICTITNNIVLGAKVGIGYYNIVNGGGVQNSLVANNTVVNCTAACILIEPDAGHSGNVVRNNIMYGLPPYGATNGWSYDYNDWFQGSPAGGFVGAHDILVDPLFVAAPWPGGGAPSLNPTTYKLLSGSPARNTGVNMFGSGVTTDYGGNARPSTGNFSMGAWQ